MLAAIPRTTADLWSEEHDGVDARKRLPALQGEAQKHPVAHRVGALDQRRPAGSAVRSRRLRAREDKIRLGRVWTRYGLGVDRV